MPGSTRTWIASATIFVAFVVAEAFGQEPGTAPSVLPGATVQVQPKAGQPGVAQKVQPPDKDKSKYQDKDKEKAKDAPPVVAIETAPSTGRLESGAIRPARPFELL